MTGATEKRPCAGDRIQIARDRLTAALLGRLGSGPVWRGHLSSSALSTAVATFALLTAGDASHRAAIRRGLRWLTDHRNPDGGWGDTTRSRANLSTTLLARAALMAAEAGAGDGDVQGALHTVDRTIEQWVGTLQGDAVAAAVLDHYGSDRTFSVPILAMCAAAGALGPDPDAWDLVPQLPFELGCLPRWMYQRAGLSVVSYALPALIAFGILRHRCGRKSPAVGWLRSLVERRSLALLERLQPPHGGFLEAAPLTGFVAMALARAGLGTHRVVTQALRFLVDGQRDDGSWPIDTDLSTWVTTLAVNAAGSSLPRPCREAILGALLEQQMQGRHPYTGAAPGGWGWTDRPGGVPDADDTAGALLALHELGRDRADVQRAAAAGIEWLLGLQNRDGGMPTFCRGWGALPFDRSCADISAHAMRAFAAWQQDLPQLRDRIRKARRRCREFLLASQHPDGSWLPLWFGNEQCPDQANPTVGTARVVRALAGAAMPPMMREKVAHGTAWLRHSQNEDGGWGGDRGTASSVEETALAVAALSGWEGASSPAASRGVRWLTEAVLEDRLTATPIGLYFASLWYFEDMYPLVFALDALNASRHAAATAPGSEA